VQHENPRRARRSLTLAVIGPAQPMIVLDVTIVNIALPDAQLHSYTTAFWWSAGIFAAGAVGCGLPQRPGVRTPAPGAAPVVRL
jgi:hypothetical protein